MQATILSLVFALAMAGAARAEPGPFDVYVSTGDNHFLGSSLPIDSPASIESRFDLFKNVNRARRIYWRGLEEACWVSTMHARPENVRYHSLWEWMQWLYTHVRPDALAVKAAHSRGMEIWGVGSLWDWGAPADTPTFGDYPFPFESKLKLEHPEWAPVDRHGVRRQGGPIELAYPEARRALVEVIVRETFAAGYDGITFLTYVENYSMRFQDEFGFSEPIVRDFKALHGIDLTREPFKRGASREDWLRLRGSYATAFLRELKAALAPHKVKLGMILNPNDLHAPLPWNVPELMLTAGSHFLDVETWVRDGLIDSLCVYGNSSRLAQAKAIDDLIFLARHTRCEVSFMTSSPLAEGWREVQEAGVATVMAVSDDAQHLARGFVPEQDATAIRDEIRWKRLRLLQQVIEGKPGVTAEEILPLTKSPDVIERRMALQALGKTGPRAALLEALDDPENGVRCAAALALGELRDPAAWRALLDAVERHGNHMLAECVNIALRRMTPQPVAELGEAALKSRHERVREVALRALQPGATAASLPIFIAALGDARAFNRYVAADALGNIRHSPAAAEALLNALAHRDAFVANRAALSLAAIAQRKEPELAPFVPRITEALKQRFITATALDDGWSFRACGNALRNLGEPGERILREIRDSSGDSQRAEMAWRVLDLVQEPNTFSEATAKGNDVAHARKPGGAARNGEIHVDPATGADANDGRGAPVKTIARAIKLAQPGDTIHLAPVRYLESADLSTKRGEPDKPITLDGHGAVLDGSEPIRAAEWETLGGGLFRKVKLLPRMDDAIVGRWFFLWDGRMNHMGRTAKGPSAPLKQPADLQPGEWTYVKDEDAFYLRIAAETTLDEAKIRYPARSSGVIQSGGARHLVVRNVIATRVYNDGFNIHGSERDCVFENIAAIECGDDGFSAHEDAECRIDGFFSIGNSTGITDTVSSVTHFRNVFIKDCLGYDVYFIGDSPHSIENAIVESRAHRTLEISQHPYSGPTSSMVRLKNVLFRRVAGKPGDLRVGRGGKLMAERCTFIGMNAMVTPGGEMTARGCLFTGEPKPDFLLFPNTIWTGDHNVFDLQSLRVDKTTFTARNFADFQKLTGGEANSRWGAGADAGADVEALRGLETRAEEVLKRWREVR